MKNTANSFRCLRIAALAVVCAAFAPQADAQNGGVNSVPGQNLPIGAGGNIYMAISPAGVINMGTTNGNTNPNFGTGALNINSTGVGVGASPSGSYSLYAVGPAGGGTWAAGFVAGAAGNGLYAAGPNNAGYFQGNVTVNAGGVTVIGGSVVSLPPNGSWSGIFYGNNAATGQLGILSQGTTWAGFFEGPVDFLGPQTYINGTLYLNGVPMSAGSTWGTHAAWCSGWIQDQAICPGGYGPYYMAFWPQCNGAIMCVDTCCQ